MIITNIKNKLAGVKRMNAWDMSDKIMSGPQVIVVDAETYANGFDHQEVIDQFLDEKIKEGKKITGVTPNRHLLHGRCGKCMSNQKILLL